MTDRWRLDPSRRSARSAARDARIVYATAPHHRHYFAFVEDVSELEGDVIDGPDGRPLDDVVRPLAPVRIRLSGITVEAFDRLFGDFEPIEAIDPTDEQRAQRRRAWRELREAPRLPVIDLLLGRHSPLYRSLDRQLVAGSWWLLLMGSPRSRRRPVVYLGAPELPEPVERRSLRSIRHVADADRVRLTDIFSLVHVGDADFGPPGEGGTEPPGLDGDDGGGDGGGGPDGRPRPGHAAYARGEPGSASGVEIVMETMAGNGFETEDMLSVNQVVDPSRPVQRRRREAEQAVIHLTVGGGG